MVCLSGNPVGGTRSASAPICASSTRPRCIEYRSGGRPTISGAHRPRLSPDRCLREQVSSKVPVQKAKLPDYLAGDTANIEFATDLLQRATAELLAQATIFDTPRNRLCQAAGIPRRYYIAVAAVVDPPCA